MRSSLLPLLARVLCLDLVRFGVEAGVSRRQGVTAKVPPRTFWTDRDQNDLITMLETTAFINNWEVAIRISAPESMYTTSSGVDSSHSRPAGSEGPMGLHVILDDDNAPLYYQFPFEGLQNDTLINVMVIPVSSTPSLWGQHASGPRVFDGKSLPDGAADAAILYDLVTKTLPQYVAYNRSTIYFTGIGGGSLLLGGYFMPSYMYNFGTAAAGVALLCGGLWDAPGVQMMQPETWISTTRIHYHSTKQESPDLRDPLETTVIGFEGLAGAGSPPISDVGQLQTVDNTPDFGHCVFDGQDAVSGVQAFLAGYSNVMYPDASGVVPGIDVPSLLTTVKGNENLRWDGS